MHNSGNRPNAERACEGPKAKFAVSGLFLTRPTTGMERYAIEVVTQLDSLIKPDAEELYLVVPTGTSCAELNFRNVRVVEAGPAVRGNISGYLWEQIWFAHFLLKNDAQGYLPLNFVPAVVPDVVVTIHDGNALSHPEFYPTIRKRGYRLLAASLLRIARRRTHRIFTVSEAARDELVKQCSFDPDTVNVASPGLDHVSTQAVSERVEVPEPFYFALSSATFNKNFEWVIKTAVMNPQANFVVAGTGDFRAILNEHGCGYAPPNVHHLGYVTDAQRNWLYSHCTAFLFPSRYEGFGFPPLEAACLGAPVIVSGIPSMREIFGQDFRYIDPEKPVENLLEVTNYVDVQTLRNRFKWTAAAERILQALREPCSKTPRAWG